MTSPNHRAYDLAAFPATGWIAARGPDRILHDLELIPGARPMGSYAADGYVLVPATRENFLAVEALAAPNSASVEYQVLREQTVGLDPEEVQWYIDNWGSDDRQLMPHQAEFIAHAHGSENTFNGSEQGTGKTMPELLLLSARWRDRFVIIAPKTLGGEWIREAAAVARGRVEIVDLTSGRLEERHARILELTANDSYREPPVALGLIVNYEAVKDLRDALAFFAPQRLVCDESWKLKNPKSKVTKAVKFIRERSPGCTVHLLTGTPVGNHAGDFYAQLDLLGAIPPSETYDDFCRRYVRSVRVRVSDSLVISKAVGCADPAGLMRRVAPYWYRATKAACLTLPPPRRERVVVQLPEPTRRLYEQVQDRGEAALGRDTSLAGAGVILIRLHQIAGGHRVLLHDPLLLTGGEEEPEDQLLRLEPCPKIEWLTSWTADHLAGDPSVRAIVWCRYNSEVERVGSAMRGLLGLDRVVEVTARTKNSQLEEWKESFNSRDEEGVQVIVAQTLKLCAGHNLQAGDFHVFFSNYWSYLVRSQAEARSHRQGRADRSPVTYIDVIAERTVDELIMGALDEKHDLAVQLAPVTYGREMAG